MTINLLGGAFGWRELVLCLIVLVAFYMGMVLIRMRRLRRKSDAAPAPSPVPAPLPTPEAPPAPSQPRADEAPGKLASIWQETQFQLAQDIFRRDIETELAQLREELDALRGEVAALRDDMRQEVGQMRATQTVSPLYTEAMQMALCGHDAALIAERCGIARAEAELVVALIKSQKS